MDLQEMPYFIIPLLITAEQNNTVLLYHPGNQCASTGQTDHRTSNAEFKRYSNPPLNADEDGTISNYTINSLPLPSQGVLFAEWCSGYSWTGVNPGWE